MNSALAAVIGLCISIVLIIRKVSPVFSLMLGALVGGLLAGWGLETTVAHMVGGVKDVIRLYERRNYEEKNTEKYILQRL